MGFTLTHASVPHLMCGTSSLRFFLQLLFVLHTPCQHYDKSQWTTHSRDIQRVSREGIGVPENSEESTIGKVYF